MKIAIVGVDEQKLLNASLSLDYVYKFCKQLMETELKKGNFIFVSGRCPKKGIDVICEEIADINHIEQEICPAEANQWEDRTIYGNLYPTEMQKQKGYKSRNIQIAEACDVLYCIVPKIDTWHGMKDVYSEPHNYCKHCNMDGHPSNGACWTLKYCRKHFPEKETHLIIIE